MQLKLEEIIRAHEAAEDEMVRVEDASHEHLRHVERDFKWNVERRTERRTAAQR